MSTASLTIARQGRLAASRVSTCAERLSSGLRVRRAVDDAAGLAVIGGLNIDNRVLTQAVRNINDGISFAAVAEGALQALSTIALRQIELSERAANGSLSSPQRRALDLEAHALSDERERIIASTSVNGRQIFQIGTEATFRIAGGYGAAAATNLDLSTALTRVIGTGTFNAPSAPVTLGAGPYAMTVADLNNDSYLDLIEGDIFGGGSVVRLANADGSFAPAAAYGQAAWQQYRSLTTGDINSDGNVDIIAAGSVVSMFLGNGDGKFKARADYGTGAAYSIALADLNNDGKLDAVYSGNGYVSVLPGNGDGSFKAALSTLSGNNSTGLSIAIFDADGDGALDVVHQDGYSGSTTLSVLLGKGDGTFQSRASYGTAAFTPVFIAAADYNGDSKTDIAIANIDGGAVTFLAGNGDGTFKTGAISSFALNAVSRLLAADLNDDGAVDLIAGSPGTSQTLIKLGNGDGTFRSAQTISAAVQQVALGDMDQDGVTDLVQLSALGATTYTAVTTRTLRAARFDLTTQAGARAALPVFRADLLRTGQQLGVIGASQSRLSHAVSNVSQAASALKEAQSRIEDVDVASEEADYLRSTLLEQAAASILAQANQLPELGLRLLQG